MLIDGNSGLIANSAILMDCPSRPFFNRKLGRLRCLCAQLEDFSALYIRNQLRRPPEVLRNVELDYFGHGNLLRPGS